MINLVSLTIQDPPMCEEFYSVFRNCLQQSSFQQLSLLSIYDLPLSILDNAKNIKHLTLSFCTTDGDQPAPGLPPSQLSLETLILRDVHNPDFPRWTMRWVTHLTTLEILDLFVTYNTADAGNVFEFSHKVPISLVEFDWSPFGHLQSGFTGTRPRIDLCVTCESMLGSGYSAESILDALMKIDVLMDSVEQGLVVLRSERHTSA